MPEMMRQVAQQNNRLLMLLEQITGNQEATTQRSAPEKILESLASNIKEFHFDPENGLTFDRWFSKYEDLFRQDGRSLDDAAKVRLLLRSLSVPVHEKFLNYLLPSHPRDFTFDDVVAKLKQIFGQQKSLFSKRYDCLKLEKSEADDFVSYAGIVNRQCEDFQLQKLTVDQFKSSSAVSNRRRTPTSGLDFCPSSSPIKLTPSTWKAWSPSANACRTSSTTRRWWRRNRHLQRCRQYDTQESSRPTSRSRQPTVRHPHPLAGSAVRCIS